MALRETRRLREEEEERTRGRSSRSEISRDAQPCEQNGYICTYVCVCVCVCVYVCICMRSDIRRDAQPCEQTGYICTYTCIYIYAHIHNMMYVFIYVFMYNITYIYIFRMQAQPCQQKACERAEKEESLQVACKGSLQRLQQKGGKPLTYEGLFKCLWPPIQLI